MTTARDTPASRRTRANGDGTVYQRKDSRWEAAGYVLAPGNDPAGLFRARRGWRLVGRSRGDSRSAEREPHQHPRGRHPALKRPSSTYC